LFNHESPLRPERFVTQKIIRAATRIANGSNERLELGNIEIYRDWGWAPDYVEAMWLMLQQHKAEDYVIATGETYSLEQFVSKVFRHYSLDWRRYVDFNNQLRRPTDINFSRGNPNKAKLQLGWKAHKNMDEIIQNMCIEADRK
jgi:GDPmannose 4,6-dehydratase